jgi:uncharacterized protein
MSNSSNSSNDINAVDSKGYTALHRAVNNADLELVNELLQHPEINVMTRSVYGTTPLHAAAKNEESSAVAIVTGLLNVKGIDVNVCDSEGRTPLYYATLWGTLEVMKVLTLAPGVDVNLGCMNGMNPWFLSCDYPRRRKIILEAPGFDINARNRYGLAPYNMAYENPKLLKKLKAQAKV